MIAYRKRTCFSLSLLTVLWFCAAPRSAQSQPTPSTSEPVQQTPRFKKGTHLGIKTFLAAPAADLADLGNISTSPGFRVHGGMWLHENVAVHVAYRYISIVENHTPDDLFYYDVQLGLSTRFQLTPRIAIYGDLDLIHGLLSITEPVVDYTVTNRYMGSGMATRVTAFTHLANGWDLGLGASFSITDTEGFRSGFLALEAALSWNH